MDSQLNWLPYVMPRSKSPCIKDEPAESILIRLSPSAAPSSLSATSASRPSSTPSTGPRRQRPYPPLKPVLHNRRAQSVSMSSSHSYETWSGHRSGSGRSNPVDRRSSDGEQPPYGTLNSYMGPYMVTEAELRPPSSNSSLTSSLTGAMGETSIPSHSRSSGSPPSTIYSDASPSQNLSWPTQINLSAMNNNGYSGHGNLGFNNMDSPTTAVPFNDYSGSRNPSPPESLTPPSPPYPQQFPSDQYSIRNQMGPPSRSNVSYGGSSMSSSFTSGHNVSMSVDGGSTQLELRRLLRRVHQLEVELNRSRTTLEALRSGVSSLPTPPHSSSFQARWKARTEARRKLFCSLNRAGNALCAWHDSRRERRAFPPRNAPPGYLNCGCTFNEALFEESLSRHAVGSYHPGETVRMDPALRNPLLKLLEKRYGYKDGDFEHDPITEDWADGESPSLWEQKAHSGQLIRRRPDTNSNGDHRA